MNVIDTPVRFASDPVLHNSCSCFDSSPLYLGPFHRHFVVLITTAYRKWTFESCDTNRKTLRSFYDYDVGIRYAHVIIKPSSSERCRRDFRAPVTRARKIERPRRYRVVRICNGEACEKFRTVFNTLFREEEKRRRSRRNLREMESAIRKIAGWREELKV